MGLSALTGPYFIIAPLSAQDQLCPIQLFSVTLSCFFPFSKELEGFIPSSDFTNHRRFYFALRTNLVTRIVIQLIISPKDLSLLDGN